MPTSAGPTATWPAEQIKELIELAAAGVHVAEIARRLGKSYYAIRCKGQKLRIKLTVREQKPSPGRHDRIKAVASKGRCPRCHLLLPHVDREGRDDCLLSLDHYAELRPGA